MTTATQQDTNTATTLDRPHASTIHPVTTRRSIRQIIRERREIIRERRATNGEAARAIAAYPATRSVAVVVLPTR